MGLSRCILGAFLLWLGLAATAAAAPGDARAVLQQKVGPGAAQAFYLAEALRRLERPAEAAALERYLLHAYVQEVGGEAPDPARTVEQAVALGGQLPAPEQSVDLRARWRQHLNARLALELPSAPRPLPGEMESLAGQLKELSPGLWGAMNGSRPRALYLFTAFANRSMVPLALSDFQMEVLPKPGAEGLKFSCAPERDKPTPVVVAAGQRMDFLCRSTAIPANDAGEKAPTVLALAHERQLLRLDSRELDDARSVARVGKVLAASRQAELAALLQTQAAAQQPAPATSPEAKAQATAGPAEGKPEATGWAVRGRALLHLLLFFAALALYWGLAKVLGNGTAAFLAWLGGTIYIVSFMVKDPSLAGRDWGAIGAAMVYGALLMGAIIAAWFLHFMFKVVDGTFDREASNKQVLTIVFEVVVGMVLALITGKRR